MNHSLRWIVLVALLVVCAGLGYAAYTLAGISWSAVVEYSSPYAGASLPAAEPGSAVASRTVLVIVDGLRLDASRKMSSLNSLRGYGADMTLTVPQPSLSYPNWTTILSGAPPYISGVVTNWHKGPAPVETVFDTAARKHVKTVFVGPEDFEPLFRVKEKTSVTFMRKWQKQYLTSTYVDEALRLASAEKPSLIVLHLPDVDEAGHDFGGASKQYAQTAARVDSDLRRLVEGLQDGHTVFVVVADHGHIDTGGHGGWESDVLTVPGVFAGPGVPLRKGEARLEDVAPTVARFAGIAPPRFDVGQVIGTDGRDLPSRAAFAQTYERIVLLPTGKYDPTIAFRSNGAQAPALMAAADSARMKWDRTQRLPIGLLGGLACVIAIALVGMGSWRALVAALAGTVAYYAVYDGLFFLVHHNQWSLSAFNSEDLVKSWMNQRLLEAALAMLVAAAVAAIVYPLLRKSAKGPWGVYRAGWLSLGPATALVVLATLGLQVAWFAWAWGTVPTWRLPDLMWGFKYDLDLIQSTAVGFAALVTPLVTYLIGRYHPKARRADEWNPEWLSETYVNTSR